MKKILNWFKENWILVLLMIVFMTIIFYCTTHSSYASDDYPYSFFYRGEERITNIIQIVKNQISDYQHISGRIVTNGLGQLVLMFPRGIFALGNSCILLLTVILSLLIVETYSKNKKIKAILTSLFIALFLSLDATKYLVYWVMGSVNYIWMMPLLLLFIYIVQKIGLFKKTFLMGIFVGLVASFHESLLVFFIIFLLGNILLDLINKKKLDKGYLFYIFMLIMASLFVFLSPGNQIRNATWYPSWNQMNLIEKLSVSIPTVSKKMFAIEGYHNLVPLLFMLLISFNLLKRKDRLGKILSISTILLYFIAILFNNGWFYFLFAGLLFISEAYYHYKNGNNNLIILSLSFYAIVYSMIITPEYAALRPSYFMYWYMIVIIGILVADLYQNKKRVILSTIIFLAFLFFSVRELIIYQKIGNIITLREQVIQEVKENNKEILFFKKIPKELTRYQMEPNAPTGENYWAKRYFCNYYNLNEDIEVKGID